MRRVGEAIQELHIKDWTHYGMFIHRNASVFNSRLSDNQCASTDVKPDNVLVNWNLDVQGNEKATDAVLGDFDIACKLEGGKPPRIPFVVDNVM